MGYRIPASEHLKKKASIKVGGEVTSHDQQKEDSRSRPINFDLPYMGIPAIKMI